MRVSLLAAVAALVLAAPAAAQDKARQWAAVMAERGVERTSKAFTLKPGRIADGEVTVRLRAREQVSFPDALYGATAWKWTGARWRRADSADLRPTVVRDLAPGERAKVALELARRARKVRVLVPTTPERAGRWVDVP